MSTLEKGQIMTANRLRDGEAVFYTPAGKWSELIDDAVLVTEPQAAKALETRGQDDERATLVTGVYLVDAVREQGHVKALHIRERIRALGPSVRLDLGKQAEGKGSVFSPVLAGE
jgi:hypothetical protein